MSSTNSTNKLDKALLSTSLPEDERYYGLQNFGNTCYCNSVLQALYFCEPFRNALLKFSRNTNSTHMNTQNNMNKGYNTNNNNQTLRNAVKGVVGTMVGNGQLNGSVVDSVPGTVGSAGESSEQQSNVLDGNGNASSLLVGEMIEEREEETMLSALTDLFKQIHAQKKRTGSLAPKSFVDTLRKNNELFASFMHQDAHEFLNFLLNDVADCAKRETLARKRRAMGLPPRPLKETRAFSNSNVAGMEEEEEEPEKDSFVHELFEGKLTNEVRCLCCETITRRDESFLDLSIDVEQNSSVTSCLKSFSAKEMLRCHEKFFCDTCNTLQEAERCLRVKSLPVILALHLKRFKFVENFQKFKKLSYRVVFPMELRLTESGDCDKLFELFAVVVHVGSGPNHGHYVSLIKSHQQWLLFDDDCVEPKDESELQNVFGLTQDVASSTETGYILFYNSVNNTE